MPWQQYVADVAGEIDPATGYRVYRDIVISLMRQQGKTTYLIITKAHRALDTREPATILFGAQDGIEAKKKWLDHANFLKTTPLGRRIPAGQPVTSNGKEVLTWANGSIERPLSSRPSSGHGETVDLGLVTEAFSQTDARYENTIKPAMLTLPDAQFLVESAAGTATSTYWNEKIGLLREEFEAEPDRPRRTAFFDWSFDPDEDPGAEETWVRRIPAIGHTIRLDEIRDEWEKADTPAKVRSFKRGLGNLTDLGAATDEPVFPADDWSHTASDESVIAGPRAFALDISNDRSWASIAQAGPNAAGTLQPELVVHDRGTHWVLERLGQLFQQNPKASRTVYVVGRSQAALMTDDLQRAGITVIPLSAADYAAACAALYEGVVQRSITRRATGQLPLEIAAAGAAWTPGDVRVWSRAKSTTIISPLVAVTVAAWAWRLEETSAYDPLANIF